MLQTMVRHVLGRFDLGTLHSDSFPPASFAGPKNHGTSILSLGHPARCQWSPNAKRFVAPVSERLMDASEDSTR